MHETGSDRQVGSYPTGSPAKIHQDAGKAALFGILPSLFVCRNGDWVKSGCTEGKRVSVPDVVRLQREVVAQVLSHKPIQDQPVLRAVGSECRIPGSQDRARVS